MTARIVVSCDGAWDNGRMPCRGALPVTDPRAALGEYATRHGWSLSYHRSPDDGRDLCPAHARQEAPA